MKKLLMLGIISFALFTTSCNNDDSGNSNDTATLELRLTDGPADYEEINLDVQAVEIKMNGETMDFPINNPGIFNILELNNGVDVLLGNAVLPVGQISQIRLILGEDNTINVNGEIHPLDTPSAQQSGLKINVHYEFEPGMVYKVWLDFDAGKSIVERGNGTYGLKPVLRAYTELTNGMIEGHVLPLEAMTTVYALQNVQDTIAVAIPEPNGYFRFSGMEEGTYRLKFDAENESFQDQELNDVNVTFGSVTNVGEIILVP